MAGAVLAAGWANFNVIWNHFYAGTPQLFDTGWYAHLVHRNDFLLKNPPPVVFNSIGPLFYATHFSPGLWLLSLPSHLLPFSPPVWLALLEAVKYASVVVVAAAALHAARPGWRPATLVAGAIVIAAAPFNGVLLAASAYPHFESWFIPLALAFLVALGSGRTRLAAGCFLGAVSIREDMGFHLCGLLVLTALAVWWRCRCRHPALRPLLAFALAGFAWSVGALVLMRLAFPGDDAFGRVYLGEPPFSHLSPRALIDRLQAWGTTRGFIWGPAAIYLIWAGRQRAGWMLIGYLAFVPWALVNLLAANLAAAHLSLYYSFPFAVALLWPLAGARFFTAESGQARWVPVWVALATLVSIAGYLRGNDAATLARDMVAPHRGSRSALHTTVDRLAAAHASGAPVTLGAAVAALSPGAFSAANLFGLNGTAPALSAHYQHGPQADIAWRTSRHLPFTYRVAGTGLIVQSAARLAWPELVVVSERAGSILPALYPSDESFAWASDPSSLSPRLVNHGPRWWLPAGERWRVRVWLAAHDVDPAREAPWLVEVVSHGGERRLAAESTAAFASDPLHPPGEVRLEFLVPDELGSGVEVRVWRPASSAGPVQDVVLEPVPTGSPRDAEPGPSASNAWIQPTKNSAW